jgi:AraC-like DNA-binding protein
MGELEASPHAPNLTAAGMPAANPACCNPVQETSDGRWAPLLEACFADFTAAAQEGDAARTTPLVKALAALALIACGIITPASRRGQLALRVGRLSLARQLIARHLSQPTLSPAMLADLLGVSVRHMHMLFEGTGMSFSQTVTVQRIRLSRRLLLEAPRRQVTEIARASGFDSLATFYRVFHATTGMTPRDFRAQGAQAGPASPSPADHGASADLTAR